MEELHLNQFWFQLLKKDSERRLWHAEIEIIFLLQGTGRIYFSDLKTVYTLKERDIFVVNAFEVQEFELDKDGTALSFLVSSEFVRAVAPELLRYRINCRSFLHVEENQSVYDLLRKDLAQIFLEIYKKEAGSAYSKSSVAAILGDLSHYFLDKSQPLENSGIQATMKTLTDYIHQHYREHLTLEELAQHTYLSKTYISRSFSRCFGVSFTAYLDMLRLTLAVRLLKGQGNLTEIAEECGFANVNAMILAFKRYWGITPGEYRRMQKQENKIQENIVELSEDQETFQTLMAYAKSSLPKEVQVEKVTEVTLDVKKKKGRLSSHWRRMFNAGYARSLLDGKIQRELRYLQEKVGFEYIRVKGVLDDDMCLLRLDMNGTIILNYACIDEGVDFILSLGAKPVLELGFMPGLLAERKDVFSMRNEIVSPPADLEKWKRLIRLLVEHLVKRYGTEKVSRWLFAPWIAPDFSDLGLITREEYIQTYVTSACTIREVLPMALLVGPGSVSFENCWPWYLSMCREHACMPDIISFRSYAAANQQEEGMNLIGNNESFSFSVSKDEDFLAHTAEQIRKILERDELGNVPLLLEEWSNNIWQRDLCNDTCYKSAYLFKNILENNQHLNAMGYFALNDRLDEVPPSSETFHGGFGLFTQNDIPKSACLAMELLAKMGDTLLAQGEGYLVSEKQEEIQIFLYHYCHYDLLYRYRHVVNMSRTNREEVFVQKNPKAFYIRLQNLPKGSYTVCRYGITKDGGSSYDAWVKMGAPSPLKEEEQKFLHSLACPEYFREQIENTDGEVAVKMNLSPHEVFLIRIYKE